MAELEGSMARKSNGSATLRSRKSNESLGAQAPGISLPAIKQILARVEKAVNWAKVGHENKKVNFKKVTGESIKYYNGQWS
jgi:hypothetical protein